ncbi:MAG: hypothetical protein ACYS7Y_36600, partial [Planctomycetota bacterium]
MPFFAHSPGSPCRFSAPFRRPKNVPTWLGRPDDDQGLTWSENLSPTTGQSYWYAQGVLAFPSIGGNGRRIKEVLGTDGVEIVDQ